MKKSPLRIALDITIIVVAVLGVAYYLPKLNTAVAELVVKGPNEPDWDPRYPHAIRILGLVPLIGSLAMLVPCLSYFSAPAPLGRRVLLGTICFLPLALALYGSTIGLDKLTDIYLKFGLLFSLGAWFFGLPTVFANISFIDLAGKIKQAMGLKG